MNWASKQQYIQSEVFNVNIKCIEKYFGDELTIKELDKMKHLLYKYLKNMN